MYKQINGGPIGENFTTIAAEIVMYRFAKKYKVILAHTGLLKDTILCKIYVDDLNQVSRILPYGTFFESGKLYIPGKGWAGRIVKDGTLTNERMAEIETLSNDMNMSEVTESDIEAWSASVYRKMANIVLPNSVKMKEDYPSKHSNGMLLILDTMMCIKNGVIVHNFYPKTYGTNGSGSI